MTTSHADLGDVLNRLAFIAVASKAPDQNAIYQEATAFAAKATPPFFVTDGHEYLAWAAHQQGDLTLAETLYQRALPLYRAQLPEGHLYRAAATSGLGAVLLDGGRRDEAAPYLQDGLSQWQRAQPPNPARVAGVQGLLDRVRQVR